MIKLFAEITLNNVKKNKVGTILIISWKILPYFKLYWIILLIFIYSCPLI